MKKDNFHEMNKQVQDINKKINTEPQQPEYMYYSKVLKEPFESLAKLKAAEEAYYAKMRAKEDKAAQKKAEAKKVEDAFVALNATRKAYKDELALITTEYAENLNQLREEFDRRRKSLADKLARAEDVYSRELSAFTAKYPEGFHLTLKDGDFEKTISCGSAVDPKAINLPDLLNWLTNCL